MSQLACNLVDNFAQSLPTDSDSGVGAVVDEDKHLRALAGKSIDGTVFDFKTQVQQFTKHEQARSRMGSQTVFIVSFGLWDIVESLALELDVAMRAIDKSIAELFSQLNILAMYGSTNLGFILPQMVDVTYLPRLLKTLRETSEHFAENQQKGILLTAYWNALLFRSASDWEHGKIYMPDPNAVVMDEVRARQLQANTYSSAERRPVLEHLEQPCLTTFSDSSTSPLQATTVEKCSDSTAHLFW